MIYRTTCAIVFKGERVAKGEEVEMTEKEAANLAGDVTPVDGVVEEPAEEAAEEKSLEEMSHAELKAKAEELSLAKSGSKAALIDRITLHIEGVAEEVEETEEEA